MARATKKSAEINGHKHLYINVLDIKDEQEQELLFKRIQQVIKESKMRIKVF